MIIWSGLGYLIAVIGVGCLAIAEACTRAFFKDPTYYQTHGWPKLAGLWIAAILVYFLARRLERQPGWVVIDKATGQEVVLKKKHDLFNIPIHYWSYIFTILGLVFFFVKVA